MNEERKTKQTSTAGISTRHNPTIRKQVSNSRNNVNSINSNNNSVNHFSKYIYRNASWR